MWNMTDKQAENYKIGIDTVLPKKYPDTTSELEEMVVNAFIARAKARGTNISIAEMFAKVLCEEELYLIMPIIRRFFTQR